MVKGPRPDWKELCYLWASDFRTHLTEQRWENFKIRLAAAEEKYAQPAPPPVMVPDVEPSEERHLSVETPTINARLDRRRGLALERLRFDGNEYAIIGGIPHGDGEVKLLGRIVHHEQRPVVRAEVFRDLLHDGLQDGVEVQGRRERLRHLVEDRQLLEVPLPVGDGLSHRNGHNAAITGSLRHYKVFAGRNNGGKPVLHPLKDKDGVTKAIDRAGVEGF